MYVLLVHDSKRNAQHITGNGRHRQAEIMLAMSKNLMAGVLVKFTFRSFKFSFRRCPSCYIYYIYNHIDTTKILIIAASSLCWLINAIKYLHWRKCKLLFRFFPIYARWFYWNFQNDTFHSAHASVYSWFNTTVLLAAWLLFILKLIPELHCSRTYQIQGISLELNIQIYVSKWVHF